MKKGGCAFVVLALFGLPCAAHAAPASVPVPFPSVDGLVDAIAVDGDVAYLGGHFTSVGPSAGSSMTVSAADGSVQHAFPAIAGRSFPYSVGEDGPMVLAIQPDGAGGWFVGGAFNRVQGRYRPSLVHLLPDGTLDPAFRADVLGQVDALALRGDTLYVGGRFRFAAGRVARNLVALDARTGAPRPFADRPYDEVTKLAVAGDRLIVVGGSPLAVDAGTGEPAGWQTGGWHGSIQDVAVAGGTVYLAGLFTLPNRPDHQTGILALDAADGHVLPIDFPLRDAPLAIAADDRTVFAGGAFGLAGFDRATGAQRPWFAGFSGFVRALALDGDRLFTDGMNDAAAAFDRSNGTRLGWSPPGLSDVWVMAASGGAVALAGAGVPGGVPRHNLAAVRLSTGEVLPFDAGLDPDGTVSALVKAGSKLLVGGTFASVGGQAHRNLAAVDAVSGSLLADGPANAAPVNALAVSGSTLFAGGITWLGAFDLASGTARPWAPHVTCQVTSLAVSGGALYAGGCFDHELAAYDVATLQPLDAPSADAGWVNALAPDGAGGVWVGGAFRWLDGIPYLAHLDARRQLDGRAPAVDGPVYELGVDGDALYLGGDFTRVAGADREHVAEIDSAGVTGFRPAPTTRPFGFAPLAGGGLLVGSGGSAIGDGMRFAPSPPPPAPVTVRRPRIVGDGTTLVADGPDFTGDALALTVRWLRCDAGGGSCVPTGDTGWAIFAEAGATYRVEVTAHNDGGDAVALSDPGPSKDPGGTGEGLPVDAPAASGAGTTSPGDSLTTPASAGSPSGRTTAARAGTQGGLTAPASARDRGAVSARIVRTRASSVRVRLRCASARRVIVRIRLARGTRAVVGRATVALRAGTTRDVTVRVSRQARHRKLALQVT